MNEKLPTLGKSDFVAKYLTWGVILIFYVAGVYYGIEGLWNFYRTGIFRFVLVTVINFMGMTIVFGILWKQRQRNKRIKVFMDSDYETRRRDAITEREKDF